MGKRVRALLFGILAAGVIASPVLSQGGVYRWKDADGVVHLTDTPPPTGAGSPQHPSEGKATSTSNDSARGLTWGTLKEDKLPPGTVDVNCHGEPKVDPRYAHEGSCNPYQGDTSCKVRLPLLCFKSDGSAPPEGVARQDVWAGGQVAITAPTVGTALTSADKADALCSSALGTGWRMAEFHDGKRGWGFVARGHISSASRFWVRIQDQPGNCWDSGSDAALPTASGVPVGPPRGPEPSRIPESEALSRAIERRLAEAKPAPAPPLAEANQALRQVLAARAVRIEEMASVARADSPKDPKEGAAARERLNQLDQQIAKGRQALASARISQLVRCGRIEEAGGSVVICDGQVDLVDTCGQPRHVRDLLYFEQQGGTWITGESTEVLQNALRECRDGR